MKSQNFFSVLLVLLVLSVLIAVLWPKQWPKPPPATSPGADKLSVNTSSMETSAPVPAVKPVATLPTNSVVNANPATSPSRTVAELQLLAMNHDADSLKTILAELTNPNAEIRAAAREAAVQFGDRSAAPVLRAAAATTEDLDEKKALLDAADFLELPPLEVRPSTNPPASR